MMLPDQKLLVSVHKWLEKAGQDLTACDVLLESGTMLTGVVAFHAQHAAEKYIKALLTFREKDFPKTHDITHLLEIVALTDKVLAASLDAAEDLTAYGVLPRYPGDLPEISLDEARHLYQLAIQVRDGVLAVIPPLP